MPKLAPEGLYLLFAAEEEGRVLRREAREAGIGGALGLLPVRFLLLDRGDEPIPNARHGLEVARHIGIIFQGIADLAYGEVDAVLEIYEGVLGPQSRFDLRTGDDLARAGGEEDQELCRLGLELDPGAMEVKLQ